MVDNILPMPPAEPVPHVEKFCPLLSQVIVRPVAPSAVVAPGPRDMMLQPVIIPVHCKRELCLWWNKAAGRCGGARL